MSTKTTHNCHSHTSKHTHRVHTNRQHEPPAPAADQESSVDLLASWSPTRHKLLPRISLLDLNRLPTKKSLVTRLQNHRMRQMMERGHVGGERDVGRVDFFTPRSATIPPSVTAGTWMEQYPTLVTSYSLLFLWRLSRRKKGGYRSMTFQRYISKNQFHRYFLLFTILAEM